MEREDAMATFSALVASVRQESACILEGKDADGRDVMVICHVTHDEGDGTMGVIPLATMLDDETLAGIELHGRVAHRPADHIQLHVKSENDPKN